MTSKPAWPDQAAKNPEEQTGQQTYKAQTDQGTSLACCFVWL